MDCKGKDDNLYFIQFTKSYNKYIINLDIIKTFNNFQDITR